MVWRKKQLTAIEVKHLNRPGKYADGDGLYLRISKTGNKSWVYRYMFQRRAREMGLGSARSVSLAAAREKATQCKLLQIDGIDPIEHRNAKHQDEPQLQKTFEQAALEYIETQRPGWKNAKHASHWENTLKRYAFPIIGAKPVADVSFDDMLEILSPIWATKTETAYRVRGRIELVLDAARVRGDRQGDNPARSRGNLDKILPPRRKLAPVKHHAALPYHEMPAIMAKLRADPAPAARTLEFIILTACRINEVVNATWDEFDEDIWTIPAARMKMGVTHRVPISARAKEILVGQPRDAEQVFPGARPGKPISQTTLTKVLRRHTDTDSTVHGFRSTFRDWAADAGRYQHTVMESALAHATDKVEAAYRRSDLLDQRRRLLRDWSRFCEPDLANVIELKERA